MKFITLIILSLSLTYSGESTFKLDMKVNDILDIMKVARFKGTCTHFIAQATQALEMPTGSKEQVIILKYWENIAKKSGITLTQFGEACDGNKLKYGIYYASLDRAKRILDKDNK